MGRFKFQDFLNFSMSDGPVESKSSRKTIYNAQTLCQFLCHKLLFMIIGINKEVSFYDNLLVLGA